MTPVSVPAFLGIVSACIDSWKKKHGRLESFGFPGWFVLGMYFTCMSAGTWNHYGCLLLPIFPVGIYAFYNSM